MNECKPLPETLASGPAPSGPGFGGAASGSRRLKRPALGQGLTLVHFSAQLEPCLAQQNTLHTQDTP